MRATVKTKATVFTVLIIVVVSFIYTLDSIRTEKRIVRDQVVKRAEAMTTLATKTLELPVLSGNRKLLKDAARFLRSFPEVSSVGFYDKELSPILQEGTPFLAPLPVPHGNNLVPVEDGDSFTFCAPVLTVQSREDVDLIHGSGNPQMTRETIGWIRLGFSKKSIRESERSIVARSLVLASSFTLLGSVFVYFLLSVAIRPLTRIVKVANEIANGDFSRDIVIETRDEIGSLGMAFERMKKSIQRVLLETDTLVMEVKAGNLNARSNSEAFGGAWRTLAEGVNHLTDSFAKVNAELRKSKESLETRVQERTAELERANRELQGEISDRIQAEEELLGAKEYTDNLIQGANVVVVGLDTTGCVTLFNRTAEQITGYSLAEVMGKGWFDILVPSTQYPEAREKFEFLISKGGSDQHENPLLTRSGEERIMSWRSTPILEQGVVAGTISFGIDITEHRMVEEQLRQSQKMEAVGRLAGGVAHDFNNMLTVIMGFAELSKLALEDGHPVLKNLHEITRAAERSRDITRQLLAFSRKELISPKPVNLNLLILQTEQALRRLIGEDIQMAFRPATGLWTVKVDPSQVDQILMNLAVNARDAMPAGGSLTLETANVHIDETYCQFHVEAHPGDFVQIAVSDDGSGMDSETLKHIFEPFFTTKDMSRGTGLGLATVFGIVAQNYGFLNVYSEPGHGTTFRIYLPRIEDASLADPQPVVERPSGQGMILLIEDDVNVLTMTTAVLEEIGYKVLPVGNPAKAIELFNERWPEIDLVVTDIIMPGMNGKEMATRMEAIRPGTKVLYMSGYTSDFIAQRGVLEDGTHFIPKPFDMKSLNEKIIEALNPPQS
jgi:PAS domain S-box-containing protein